ncbi:hypothetical protein HPP92_018293 [Vanilla planifolia]|uniref:Transcription factor MYC/MYB N-terminal domain-containing protein n=1 Tax=Vanilla planifolia TaxID=51239 RepID=A0A835QD89_VANPL|nr:hypothetical protein HPP92_018293 [Vanilla planifolia]
MEEQHLNPLAITHLLQHTLRMLCSLENSHWVYAVFWRILPRNFPPPKWELHGFTYDRARANRRNWILAWEDGFCNFASSATDQLPPLQPELFFKMSHEIYNYGEGLIGKVAADHGHKWVYSEPNEQENNFLSAWNTPADSHPRTWEAQFHSGIKTIALIAVREGVVQLGAFHKVMEDLSFVVHLRKKFAYLESIPGVLLPHPSSPAVPIGMQPIPRGVTMPPIEYYDQSRISPSMSSLEALLSKLPSVGQVPQGCYEMPAVATRRTDSGGVEGARVAKEEFGEGDYGGGESSSSMADGYYASLRKTAEY